MKQLGTQRRRPLAAVLPVIVGLAISTAGCGGGTDASNATSLTVMDSNNPSRAATVSSQLAACGKKVGVTVNETNLPYTAEMQKVLQQASSRTLPDLLEIIDPDMPQVAATGALIPLNQYGIDTGGFPPKVLAGGSYQGKQYGLGPSINQRVLFYNTDMFTEAGFSPPKTWDELKASAAKLTVPGRYGMAVNVNEATGTYYNFTPFLWSNGGDEKQLDSPQAVQALQLWVDLVRSGAMSRSVMNWSSADFDAQFAAGKTAMMISGAWSIPTLNKSPNLHWAVVPIPVPEPGKTLINGVGGSLWTVPQTGSKDRQEKAAKVLACLNDPANMLALAKQTSGTDIPSRPDVAAQYAREVPSMAVFASGIENGRAGAAELQTTFPKAAAGLFDAVQSALAGKATPEAALRHGQQIATGS